ncbi:MAG: fibronectin type III domain-containing protein [Chloroflexi bacterium]|nr:fibronectin type III domain-containing protein [Chloroflexota bacterium]
MRRRNGIAWVLASIVALIVAWAGATVALAQTASDVPEAVVGLAPPVDPREPVFTWQAGANALTYELRLQPVGGEAETLVFSHADVCDSVACAAELDALLPASTYVAWVRAVNPTGVGAWSAAVRFRLPITPPRLIAPLGDVPSVEAFTWEPAPGALWYNVQVEVAPNVTTDRWYDQFGICDETTCTGTLEIALGPGRYRWQVRSFVLVQGDNLYSEWSEMLEFTVAGG